jgi:hypothetical protein
MSRHLATPGYDPNSVRHLVSHAAQDAQQAHQWHTPNPHAHHRLLGDDAFLASLPRWDYVARNAMVVEQGSRRAVRLAVTG